MSAVILSLYTSYFSKADEGGRFTVQNVAPGTYVAHIWLEGESPDLLNAWTRTLQVGRETLDLGVIAVPDKPVSQKPHTNKFGLPYPAAKPELY